MAEFPTGGYVMAGVTPHLYLTDRNHYVHLREQEDKTSKGHLLVLRPLSPSLADVLSWWI
jgi:hypothetical protein